MCSGEVVGLITLNMQVDTTRLQANFGLNTLIDMQQQPAENHGEIEFYVMNPIFAHRYWLGGGAGGGGVEP